MLYNYLFVRCYTYLFVRRGRQNLDILLLNRVSLPLAQYTLTIKFSLQENHVNNFNVLMMSHVT